VEFDSFDNEFDGFGGFGGGYVNPYSAEFSSIGNPFFGGGGGVSIDPGVSPGGGINIDIGLGGGGGGVGGGGGTPSTNQTLVQIVDSFEAALKANLAAWQLQQKTSDVAIAAGWKLIDGMVAACRQYGAAGIKAAAERDRRVNPAMLRWDWIAYYIESITGALTTLPAVPGGPVAGGGTGGTSTLPAAVTGLNPLWIGAGLVLLIFLLRR